MSIFDLADRIVERIAALWLRWGTGDTWQDWAADLAIDHTIEEA
jgi:hypothetical protein